jgi:hypothetical protein
MEPDESVRQKMIHFATSDEAPGAIELLKKCRTQLSTIMAETEFQTLVNAITLEIETNLIQRLIISIDKIRHGETTLDE